MNIKQLKCFIQLYETRSFSQTGELLHITQPAVTHQIKKLEDELGIKLFIRDKHNVELSSAAVSFYTDVKDVLIRLNIAIAKATNYDKEFSSNLSIGYDNSPLENNLLPMILEEYQKIEKNVHIHLKTSDYIERKNELLTRKTDIIFTVKDNMEACNEVIYKELYQNRLYCVMAINDKLSRKKTIDLSDIKERPLILLNPIKCPVEMLRIQSKIQNLQPNAIVYYSDSAAITYVMIKSKIGIAIMPHFICPMDKELISIPLNIPDFISYGIAYLKENSSQQLSNLVDITQDIFLKQIKSTVFFKT
ncbi:LysR family transcriptional regulator [Pectobacteriaceae bacterium CE70]|uniref:LysR family transcriptional regulator n=1 Tax=Serratia sp. (strain ATCC 39006) TaxID=104623 RepID=A0A2I5T5Z7_SERS3|nr:LysR family transcriptional regulator [Serratia sp. ATCC 39006]WJV61515.1 LysR family transcriptional regulator [Pectobacteriaceae bacterium C52]WJV65787.1 LysR family transcriptional regulator [Pectobacteriaceae bacterium CE70]WJY09808.1 LysR family transcriptional regulator [Pectobacteriaceae bacterium C80]AUG99988.1 LysR family transcriptional regulator [Serratia sp. ATCC 39006]AUH04308.1 LysR family transcriptional regulator [Serratia sp. ATCC 39006]